MDRYLCVLVGGGTGAVLRYVIGTLVSARHTGRFPLGTFLINVTGSFAIGLLMTLFTQRFTAHANWRLFLVTGVLGGYTTFSSFEYETLATAQSGAPWISLLYVIASVAVGFLGVWLGAWCAVRR